MVKTQEQAQYKSITAEEFLKIWKGEYVGVTGYEGYYQNDIGIPGIVTFSNVIVTDTLYVNDLKNLPSIIFETCRISSLQIKKQTIDGFINIRNGSWIGNIFVQHHSLLNEIWITNSIVRNLRFYDNSEVDEIWITENSKVKNITVKDRSKAGNVRAEKGSRISGILVHKQSHIGDIIVHNKSSVGELRIWEFSQSGQIVFNTNTKANHIWIHNSSVLDFTVSDKTTIDSVDIVNCTVHNIWFYKINLEYPIIIKDSIVEGISVAHATLAHLLIQEKSKIGKIEIAASEIKDFEILDSTVFNVNIYHSSIHETDIQDSVLGDFILHYPTTGSREFNLQGCKTDELDVKVDIPYHINVSTSITNESQIYLLDLYDALLPSGACLQLSDTLINEITVDSFINNGIIVFNNINPLQEYSLLRKINKKEKLDIATLRDYKPILTKRQSCVAIINADLGNTQFIGCNLAAFDVFTFKNSKMQNVFLADTTLPSVDQIQTEDTDELEQKRLALSQFKKIYDGQGDTVRASKYRAEEMEVYRHYLINQRKLMPEIERWNRRIELINLWLNKFSNYYGNNWLRSTIVTCSTTAILYVAYCSSRTVYPANPFKAENWSVFWELFPYYFEFMNPVHKTDFFMHIKKGEPNPGALLIDYLSRIVIAYLVYQTIAAFRKFGKRSS